MYDLILFDLDGTLTDPEEGITKCVKYALEYFNIEEKSQKNLKRFIGPPLVDSFSEYYGMNEADALEAVRKYRERFSDVGLFENKIFDGIPEMLEKLKKNDKKIALATSKPHIYAKKILDHFNITKYFDVITGPELNGKRNNKAEVIEEALKLSGEYKNPVMVGDRLHDILGAKENNIPCIGVTFGYAEDGELSEYGADIICESIDELTKILLS